MMYTSQFRKIDPYDWFCAPCQIIVAVKYFLLILYALIRGHTVKPKLIQTPSTFLTLSQFIHYSLENGNKMTRTQELRTLHIFAC